MQLVRVSGTGFGVYRRRDGRYLVKWKDETGRDRQTMFSKAAEANTFCRAKYRAWNGRTVPVKLYPVRDLIDDYLAYREAIHRRKGIAENTIIRDRAGADRIRAHFGKADAGTLGRKQIRAWYDSLEADGLSDSTVANYATVLRGAYKWGMDDRGLAHLTAHPVPPVTIHDQKTGQALTIDQIRAICDGVPEVYRTFTYTLAFSGFRIEELCRLEVPDYDPDRDQLRGGMKTEAGRNRPVSIPDWLSRMIRHEIGDRVNGPLFLNRRGNRISADVWRRRTWDPTVTGLGFPAATPHWLRHSLATLLAEHGMSAYDLRTHFGWETSRVADRYVKKGQGVKRIAALLEDPIYVPTRGHPVQKSGNRQSVAGETV